MERTYSGLPGPEMVERVTQAGYRVEGLYLGTADPRIDIERIEHRVFFGTGHAVDPSRFPTAGGTPSPICAARRSGSIFSGSSTIPSMTISICLGRSNNVGWNRGGFLGRSKSWPCGARTGCKRLPRGGRSFGVRGPRLPAGGLGPGLARPPLQGKVLSREGGIYGRTTRIASRPEMATISLGNATDRRLRLVITEQSQPKQRHLA